MANNIDLFEYSFKFKDINLEYPRFIKLQNGRYFNFMNSISNSKYSRQSQLDHRSTQAIKFDTLVDINYFNFEVIKEVPLINTRPDIDPNRSYYLLDYFIPDLSLAIELDSNYHNPEYDKLKDQFLDSIGIDVYRIYNFQIDTKSKLESLVEYIKRKKEVKFELSYEELIEEYKEYKNNGLIPLDYNTIMDKELSLDEIGLVLSTEVGLSPSRSKKIAKLCKYNLDILSSLLNGVKYKFNISLDDIYNVLPMTEKKVKYYKSIIKFMRSLNIEMSVTSIIGRNKYGDPIKVRS